MRKAQKKILEITNAHDETKLAMRNAQECLEYERKARKKEADRAWSAEQQVAKLEMALEKERRLASRLKDSCDSCRKFLGERKKALQNLLFLSQREGTDTDDEVARLDSASDMTPNTVDSCDSASTI